MSIVEPAMLSSEERPVGLRKRTDLVIEESVYQGEYCWIVKDPLAMKYFRLRKPGFLVLSRLADSVSYHELKLMLTRAFPESRTRLESVQQLVASLHQNGLLISNASGQALPLDRRRNKELAQKAVGLLSSLISLRFPGWDPERLLNWLYPKCRFFFTPWFTSLVIAVCMAALALLLINVDAFFAKLPDFQSFFAFDNLLFMAGILIFTKSIHELGHGLMCKHFGGECHQIGFMLLVMTPAMYCDTSDSWILRNRWHRMAIGAAGMYVELFLAAICTFVWWFTHPGWIHYLALNIMFLSSVSTVMFNANPLLRYDGYYILSDFLEIPNLAQKAKLTAISKLRVLCLGMKPLPSHLLPTKNQNLVAIYSVLSFAYRWFVTIAMLWFVSKVLEPYGLSAIAHTIIAISLMGMVVVPTVKLTKFFLYPGRLREVKKWRFYVTSLIGLLAISLFSFLPLPHYVWATFVVRPHQAQQLVLPQAGQPVQVLVKEGQPVKAGDTIAVLSNEELTIELEELKGQLARLKSDRSAFEFISTVHFDSARKIAETVAQIESLERQVKIKEHQIQQLTVKAARPGILFSPANLLGRPTGEAELMGWSGTPLDQKNQGAYLESNTLLGMIGDPENMEAILVVDQSDIKLLQVGQKVIALSRQFRNGFVETAISGISQDELLSMPRELSQTYHGPLAVKPSVNGNEQPMLPAFESYALLPTESVQRSNVRVLPNMSGHAKIHVGSSSLGQRLLRYLTTVIHFR